MRVAVVEDNTVINIILADESYVDPHGRDLIPADGLSIGMVRVGGEWQVPVGDEIQD